MNKFSYIFAAVSLTFGPAYAINTEIPDKEGMTLKGIVYCGNSPVASVQVSDGVNVTKTDENGIYYLASSKECGHVFICNPKGYKTVRSGKYPVFYKTISTDKPDMVEQADFELTKETNPDHTVVFLADIQMCGRNKDNIQYINHVVPDINSTIDSYKAKGKDVFVITLGDQSYNTYWHLQDMRIPELNEYVEKLTTDAIYNCMGNHDNSPDVAGDWEASELYRKHCGPTYYSFNAGDTHYIVLDNIEFTNPAANNTYDCNITTKITKWLRKDLANVSKTTPLVICMHAPLFERPQCSKPGVQDAVKYRYSYGLTFYNSVKDFKDVKIFTGHAHTNYTVNKLSITEYNVGAVCGNLWWTGYFVDGNSVCTDGSPAGYRILDYNDGEAETYYKSIGYNRDYQFRAYDLNNTYITAAKFAPAHKTPSDIENWLQKGPYGYGSSDYYTDGTPRHPNKILINVFGYGPDWTVEASEEGNPLEVTRISGYDPFSMISDGCQRFQNTGHNSAGNPTKNSHLFETTAKSDKSTITITVTDPYGKVYTEKMERPKEFSIAAYMSEDGKSYVAELDKDDENAEPVYYTLTGLATTKPGKGLYIMRKGSKTTKILIK